MNHPPPTLYSMAPHNTPLSSDSEEDEAYHGGVNPRFVPPGDVNLRGVGSMLGGDIGFSCVVMILTIWLFASAVMLVDVFRPTNAWIGPNSSILVEPNSVFVRSIKVNELVVSKPGLELYGFYASPHVDVMNWSESRSVSVSHESYKGWPYYLNNGASLNISYNVKPEGCSVRLVVDKGIASHWLLEASPFKDTSLSLNTIQGSGMIQVNISESQSYHVAIANPTLKDVEVELNIDVKAPLYDTKQSFYKCSFSNGECTFNTMPFVGTSLVLTSPGPRQGVLVEEQEWFIRISYQARWSSYAIVTGLLICVTLVALYLYKRLQRGEEERCVMDNDSTISLLVHKDDDSSSICSWTESLASYDADLEDFVGKETEASYGTKSLCAICFAAKRDCFFLPCGHCISCYHCGKKIAEAAKGCPICRKKMKKVKMIYTV